MHISISSKITLLFMMFLPLAHVHAKRKPANRDTAAYIRVIRAEYQKVNASSLRKEPFKYEAEGCVNDGIVTYFLNAKKEIVKIAETGNIGDGSWNREFYFRSGKFFFCYETITGGPAEGPELKNEYRTYIKDDQVLQYMEDKKVLAPGEHSAEALAISYKLLDAYHTKKFAEALCN